MDVVAVTAAVKYFFCNTDLLQILLVGVGVVGINHACRILQVLLGVQLTEQTEIFVVIVRKYLSVLVDSTAEYGVSKGVAGGVDIPSSVNKGVSMLSSNNRVEHYGHITAGRVLHTCRYVKTADGHTMLLILYGTGTDCHIRKQICQIPPVFRIEHLICCGKSGLLNVADVKFTDGNETFQKVRCCFRVRLMNHSLVSFTGRSRLVGVDTRNDDTFVFDLLLNRNQAVQIIHNSCLVVSGTWSDDNQKTVVFSGDNIGDFFISLCF